MNWDIYPQIIERTADNLPVKFICLIWKQLNNILYSKIDRMLTIGHYLKKNINAELKNPVNIDIIPIASDCDKIHPISRDDNFFIKQYKLEQKFIVLYSGRMGIGHNIGTIIETALKLRTISQIKFLIIGTGQKYDEVRKLIDVNRSDNTMILPLQDESVFPYSIACGDVCLVSQEEKLFDCFIPSRTYDMISAGQAIIGICKRDSDLGELILQNGIGEVCDNADASSVADQIMKYYSDRVLLDSVKKKARKLAVNSYSNKIVRKQYEDCFLSLFGTQSRDIK
jgi:glycosyltransferase involved in cell wall biosynthesis